MKLWLDDERPAPNGWVHVKTTGEAFHYLRTGIITEVSLDHDLGNRDRVGDGYMVLEWIERRVRQPDNYPGFKLPIVHIHTANPAARIRMQAALDSIVCAWNDMHE